jgi:nicotinamidase/pyrazinamidase
MRLDAATDALLIIDMQNDFLPGGSLAVANADQIIPDLNALADRFAHVIVTQDWHPAHHISFASTHHKRPFIDGTQATIEAPYGTQHLWPDHCLQGTHGAALHEALDLPRAELILRKGFRKDIDSYSAFLENDRTTPTGLAGYLRERNLKRLFFTGVAYDFCVGFSALAAAQLGFEAIVLEDLTRPVGLPGTVESTHQAFAEAGVRRLASTVVSQ